MRDATLDDALADLLAADGLAAKQSILARHAQLLVALDGFRGGDGGAVLA